MMVWYSSSSRFATFARRVRRSLRRYSPRHVDCRKTIDLYRVGSIIVSAFPPASRRAPSRKPAEVPSQVDRQPFPCPARQAFSRRFVFRIQVFRTQRGIPATPPNTIQLTFNAGHLRFVHVFRRTVEKLVADGRNQVLQHRCDTPGYSSRSPRAAPPVPPRKTRQSPASGGGCRRREKTVH